LFEQVVVASFEIGNTDLCNIQFLFRLFCLVFKRVHLLSTLDDGYERCRDIGKECLFFRAP
jgi:hypothetical protein